MPQPGLHPISAAGLLVTDWCSARCRHCYVSSGPAGAAWTTVDAAAAHLAALARLGVPAAGIHIGGGEPFGDFDRLMEIVRAAREMGSGALRFAAPDPFSRAAFRAPTVRSAAVSNDPDLTVGARAPRSSGAVGYVETNGFWATDAQIVRERLRALAEAGMMQLSISADPYHQEFVPPERVRLLYDVAREVLGADRVRARRWKWLQDPRDVAAMAEPARLDLFRTFLARYPERITGRAAEMLAPLLPRQPLEEIPREGCRKPILESSHVHIDPAGWVYPGTCAGIVLGRATPDWPLDRLLAECRLADRPLLAALVDGGPRSLADLAARHGFRPDAAGYASKCHLCWAARKSLVRARAGGETLMPESLYAGGVRDS